MKKIFLMLALFSAVVSANAQIATENSNALDNIGLGGTVGVTTPLDLNPMFPINTSFGVVVNKGITPVLGAQFEVVTMLNGNHFADTKTAFKGINFGLNGLFNITNAFYGYNGKPRLFETSLVMGIGAFHGISDAPNNLTAKTGLDFAFNIGKQRKHSIVFTPSVYWGLRNGTSLQFNHNNAVVSLMGTYIYHFKNSNGTHSFKTYDVGALNSEIVNLQGRLSQVEKDLNDCVGKRPVFAYRKQIANKFKNGEWVVQFAQNSAELTEEATAILDTIGQDIIVDVVGTASPEGEYEVNLKLSEKRAAVTADYLKARGVRVRSYIGKGVHIGESTNRLAIVTVVTD